MAWVGESIAETVRTELSAASQIVLSRESQAEGLRRLLLRPEAEYTKATLIKLGQSLDVTYVCYGSYDLKLSDGSTSVRDSSIVISTRFLDLRKMRDGGEFTETGKLADLSRLEEHIAWQSLKYLDPASNPPLDQFLAPQKLIRLEAEESYTRGLLSTRSDGRQKWFTQAAGIEPHFAGPAFELGKLALDRKDYRQALTWLGRISSTDPRYADARFKMGLCSYDLGDFTSAANYFREVAKNYPLNEVYNNLGAAEAHSNSSLALADFRRALEGDEGDPVYLFNVGVELLRSNSNSEGAKLLERVLDRNNDDREASDLLDRAHSSDKTTALGPPANYRLKQHFDQIAFRQLKAVLQTKGSN